MKPNFFLDHSKHDFLKVLAENQNDYDKAADFLLRQYRLSLPRETSEDILDAVHSSFFTHLLHSPNFSGTSTALKYLQSEKPEIYEQVSNYARELNRTQSQGMRHILHNDYYELLPAINKLIVETHRS